MKTENRVKLDEVFEEIYYLREQVQALMLDNDFLERQNKALKIRCSSYAKYIQELQDKNAELKMSTFLKAELAAEAYEDEVVGALGSYMGGD